MHLFRVMATESISGERVPSQFITGFYNSSAYIFTIFSQNTLSLYSVQNCSFLLNLSEIEKGSVYITESHSSCMQQGLYLDQGK